MKCFICNSKDKKCNMVKSPNYSYMFLSIFNILGYHYFHWQCMENVICNHLDYTKEKVERALKCYDEIMRQKAAQHFLKVRLESAQEKLEKL
jgi:hypothetical protein